MIIYNNECKLTISIKINLMDNFVRLNLSKISGETSSIGGIEITC